MTFAAVKLYQAQNNISQTGSVGPLTRASLNTLVSSGTTNIAIENESTSPVVADINLSTIKVTNITDTSANFSMTYQTPGFVYTTTWFEYSTSEDALKAGQGKKIGQITLFGGNNNVTSNVLGLVSKTVYYARAVGEDERHLFSYSPVSTFTTLDTEYIAMQNTSPYAPKVTTLNAGNVTSGSANVFGSYDSKGYPTTVWFEYWTSNGVHMITQKSAVGASSNTFSSLILNLTLGTRYYFRIVASNTQGTSYGAINSFLTNASAI
jgi:hypothetical protein